MHYLSILGLGVVLFATTNVDDILVLLSFFSDRAFRTRHIVAGQYAGTIAVVAVSIFLANLIPAAYVGVLGLAPLAMGVRKLIALRKSQAETDDPRAAGSGVQNVLTVAAVTIANGGDNIGVYAPLFARTTRFEALELCAVFLVMTAVWCVLTQRFVNHPAVGRILQKHGDLLLPFVYIGLGAYILIQSGTVAMMLRPIVR